MKSFLHRAVFRLVRHVCFFLAKLPESVVLRIGRIAGLCVYAFSKRRHVAYADLKAVFGTRYIESQRWQIIRDQYAHLGETAMEVIRFPFLDAGYIERMVAFPHRERFVRTIEEGKGTILLTAHFGNWELSQIVSSIIGKPIHALARDQKNSRLNELLNELRESHGSHAIGRGIGIRYLFRALRAGEPIGMLGDQDAGKTGGVILPFLGRKTTVPTGAFELARRSGAVILPCFIVRRGKGRHEIIVGEAIDAGKGDYEPRDLEPAIKTYLNLLEQMIAQYPSQWLWGTKRWKHSWTKRILILSDGKAGHLKQSQAVAAQMSSIETQYDRPGMEYPLKTLTVSFKSAWHRRLFPWAALGLLPWIQGRTGWLGFFFTPSSQKEIRAASADFIISSGSSLVPLNLCLAKESRAKSIVLMKPSFPFDRFKYDLAVVPEHDSGKIPMKTFRTILTPSLTDSGDLERSAAVLRRDLPRPAEVRIGFFIGGDTRGYKIDLASIEKVIAALERAAPECGDYLVTTSRRTPEAICRFLKSKRSFLRACQMLVIASEDKRPEVAKGMMALGEILIVTEDSISMISEAVSARKKVIVLTLKRRELPSKHWRFQQGLARRSAVMIATPDDFEEKIMQLRQTQQIPDVVCEENKALQKVLQEIL